MSSLRFLVVSFAFLGALSWLPRTSTAQKTDQKAEVHYDSGFTLTAPGDEARLSIGGRLQTRWESLFRDLRSEGKLRNATGHFRLRRARLFLSGQFADGSVRYKLHTGFGKGVAELNEYYTDLEINDNSAVLRIGQWRPPFSRQQVNSSGKLAFADRSVTTGIYGEPFDIGVGLHNNYDTPQPFGWAIGFFNGTGNAARITASANLSPGNNNSTTAVDGSLAPSHPRRAHPALVARLSYNPESMKQYTEADFEGDSARYAFGMGAVEHFDYGSESGSNTKVTGDGIFKLSGLTAIASATALFTSDNSGDLSSQRLSLWGLQGQVGYLVDDWMQPAIRYEFNSDLNKPTASDLAGAKSTHRATAGWSFYFIEHRLKWQSELEAWFRGSEFENASSSLPSQRYWARTQLQFEF